MKHIIFTIETTYSEENYFLSVNENNSIEFQIFNALAEICYCDAYEIVGYKEVDNDYYINWLAAKTTYKTLFNESIEDAFCSGKYTTLEAIENDIERRNNLKKQRVEVNSNKSYLGKEIREWCQENPRNIMAQDIMQKYYSEDVEFNPSDKVYYFVNYISSTESYKECGSLNMYGCSLHRDLKKSPRKV